MKFVIQPPLDLINHPTGLEPHSMNLWLHTWAFEIQQGDTLLVKQLELDEAQLEQKTYY